MKIKWYHLPIPTLFGLVVGLFLGSEIGVSIANELGRFIKIEAEITAYSPSPNQTWGSDPFQMASGRTATPHDLEQIKFAAPSRDLFEDYDLQYGDIVWVGFQVEDKMGPKARSGIDLFMRSIELARKFGRQSRTIIIERREK